MTAKPFNHVTTAQAALLREGSAASWPEVPEDLLLFLEGAYPPRCYMASETVEDHLLYAGAADLVQTLRVAFEDQKARAIEADLFEEDA